MSWTTEAPLTEEYQTFEYVLEYGGELETQAIVRTFLRGRPRYWQLHREYTVDEHLLPLATGTSHLSFLAHTPAKALSTCAHAWWKLTGLNVAPDLLPLVEATLENEGRTLDTWLDPAAGDDPHALTCAEMWPGCTVPRRPVDAYWLTARPETMRRVLGGLSGPQVVGLESRPGAPVGVLVDRKGRVLLTEAPDYPQANQWNAYSPFYAIEPFSVYALTDLWQRCAYVRRLHPLGLVP